MIKNNIEFFKDLGFTELEARIYLHLLSDSPATGYAIAKAINKPFSNTYKALADMDTKGLVLTDNSGDVQLFRAIPYSEVLSRLSKDYLSKINTAGEILSKIQESPDDESIYNLQSPEIVFEKFNSMLKEAKTIAIVDIYPKVTDVFQKSIEIATKNGVQVILKTNNPIEIDNVTVIIFPQKYKRVQWPGMWINLSIDFSEILLSFIGDKSRHFGVWSKNTLISKIYTDGVISEMLVDQLTMSQDKKIANYVMKFQADFRRKFKTVPEVFEKITKRN